MVLISKFGCYLNHGNASFSSHPSPARPAPCQAPCPAGRDGTAASWGLEKSQCEAGGLSALLISMVGEFVAGMWSFGCWRHHLGCGCSRLDVGSSGVLCCVCRVMGTERLGFVLAPQGCLCRMSCPFLLLCHLCCSSSWHDSTREALLLLRAREPRLARAPWKRSWALPYKPWSPSWLVAEQLAPSLSQPPVPASISISPRSCAPDVEHLIPTLALLSRVPGSGPTSSTCCSRPKPRIYLNFDPDGK